MLGIGTSRMEFMRWWLAALAFLVFLSLALAWLRPAPRTAGMDMADDLARVPHPGPSLSTRTAIQLIDFVPDPAALPAEKVSSGDGNLPGRPTLPLPDFHWAQAATSPVRFTWQARPSAREPLREALEAESGTWQRVKSALAARGMLDQSVWRLLNSATTSLSALPDQGLLQAWLGADFALLLTDSDIEAAVRDAFLLTAREERAPIVTFSIDTPLAARVYLITLPAFPQPAGWPPTIAIEVDAYASGPATRPGAAKASGELLFTGTLFMEGRKAGEAPDPALVRRWSVRMATLALEQLSPSTAPAAPQLEKLPQLIHQ